MLESLVVDQRLKHLQNFKIASQKEFQVLIEVLTKFYDKKRLSSVSAAQQLHRQKEEEDDKFFKVLIQMLEQVVSLSPLKNQLKSLRQVYKWFRLNKDALHCFASKFGAHDKEGQLRIAPAVVKRAQEIQDFHRVLSEDEDLEEDANKNDKADKTPLPTNQKPVLTSQSKTSQITTSSSKRPGGTKAQEVEELDLRMPSELSISSPDSDDDRSGTRSPGVLIPGATKAIVLKKQLGRATDAPLRFGTIKSVPPSQPGGKLTSRAPVGRSAHHLLMWNQFQTGLKDSQEFSSQGSFYGRYGNPFGRRYTSHDGGEKPELWTNEAIDNYARFHEEIFPLKKREKDLLTYQSLENFYQFSEDIYQRMTSRTPRNSIFKDTRVTSPQSRMKSIVVKSSLSLDYDDSTALSFKIASSEKVVPDAPAPSRDREHSYDETRSTNQIEKLEREDTKLTQDTIEETCLTRENSVQTFLPHTVSSLDKALNSEQNAPIKIGGRAMAVDSEDIVGIVQDIGTDMVTQRERVADEAMRGFRKAALTINPNKRYETQTITVQPLRQFDPEDAARPLGGTSHLKEPVILLIPGLAEEGAQGGMNGKEARDRLTSGREEQKKPGGIIMPGHKSTLTTQGGATARGNRPYISQPEVDIKDRWAAHKPSDLNLRVVGAAGHPYYTMNQQTLTKMVMVKHLGGSKQEPPWLKANRRDDDITSHLLNQHLAAELPNLFPNLEFLSISQPINVPSSVR